MSRFKLLVTILFILSWSKQMRVSASASTHPVCRYLPGDQGWPGPNDWTALNISVGGRLIRTIPLGSPCHNPTYDEVSCANIQQNWDIPQTHMTSPSSIMSPIFQNKSCDPYTARSSPCGLGNYAEFSINVSSAADVAAGLAFAQSKNIRLVIKNTGHDLLGKSTGKGSLSLWMHNLKSITFKNYSSQAYKGPSAKIAAGVQAYEAYAAANALGVTIVGGDCPTVGLAGGYYPGGGHGPFSSKYGLASDQILEWEAVVANGSHIVATPTQNSDLYWALSGGGAGTFAVALSVTVKTHPDGTFGGAALSFTSVGISQDTYWELIEVWHSEVLPHVVDAGGQIIYVMTAGYFAVAPLNLPGATSGQVSSLLEPLTSKLAQYNITFNLVVTLSSSFLEHRAIYAAPLPYGSYTINNTVGSRLIPRSLVENPSSRTSLMNAFRNVTASGEFGIGGIGVNVNHTVAGNQASSNAVLPAWRETLIHAIIEGPWDLEASQAGNMETVSLITNDWVPQLEHLTPGSGTYLNEADYQLTTWKEDFYGANYERLVTIKLKYDPYNVLYAHTAVGSDFWSVASDGRLCRAS